MRELKFRVWDKKMKNMAYFGTRIMNVPSRVCAGKTDLIFAGEFVGNCTEDYVLPDWREETWKARFEVMQFTGLKDKNGKEIYEGDILNCRYHETPERTEVIWQDRRAGFDMRWMRTAKEEFPTFTVLGDYTAEKCEVIGNIYERCEECGELACEGCLE